MGIFSHNYSKPGPGINKNAPKKKGIFLFFELLRRKFFKLIQANMLYILFSLPFIAILFIFSNSLVGRVVENAFAQMDMAQSEQSMLMMLSSLIPTILILVLWGSGPASAGFAYIYRCFTREEHAWIWSDFWGKLKENFKQAIIVVIIDIAALFLGINAIYFYFMQYTSQHSMIWLLLCYVSVIMMIVYTFMHYYIYQLMVTFDSKLRELYRNAVILAIGKAPMNLLLTVIAGAIGTGLYMFLTPPFAFLLTFVLFYGLARFPLEFYAARTLQKLIQNNPDNNTVTENEEAIFSDEIKYTGEE